MITLLDDQPERVREGVRLGGREVGGGQRPGAGVRVEHQSDSPMDPGGGGVGVGAPSVASEPPRQLDVEGVEVDVAHALEELGGPGVGEGLGQLIAPSLVLGLQGAELGQWPRRRPGRPPATGCW